MNERTMTFARRAGALLLACLGACGGRYDIGTLGSAAAGSGGGTTNAAGAGGTPGNPPSTAGLGATGGTSTGGTTNEVGGTSGASPTSSGGSSASGGTDAAGGSGALGGSVAAGGRFASGGAPAAGSGGSSTGLSPDPFVQSNPTCSTQTGPATPLHYATTLVTPAVLAARIGLLIEDDATIVTPPNVTDTQTASDLVDVTLAYDFRNQTSEAGPQRFIRSWLNLGDDQDSAVVAETDASRFDVPTAVLDDLVGPAAWKMPELNRVRTTIPARGDAMLVALFCANPGPNPVGIVTPEPDPQLTERQNLEQAVTGTVCVACHQLMDPLGYSVDDIDAMGMLRTMDDNGHAFDTSGSFATPAVTFPVSENLDFTSIDDLGAELVDSCEVIRCFVQTYTNFELDQLGLPHLPPEELDFVVAQFTQNQRGLAALLEAFVQTPTFLQYGPM